MNGTPPPPKRRKSLRYPGTPLLFNQTNNGKPTFHMYENRNTPNTPNKPQKMSRKRTRNNNTPNTSNKPQKRTRINTNSNTYNSNNYNNTNNNYIRPQKVISNNVKSLREECDEHIKQMDLKHSQLIDDLLRNKKNEIDNIDKKYKELINKQNKKNEDKKIKILNECEKIEKTLKNQELQRVPLRRILNTSL